jgi:hypothetical protein
MRLGNVASDLGHHFQAARVFVGLLQAEVALEARRFAGRRIPSLGRD